MSFYHKKRQSQVGALVEEKSGECSQDNKSAIINKIAENKKRKVDDDSFINDETEDSCDEEKSAARIKNAKARKRADRTPKREERAPEPKRDWETGITISKLRKVLVKKFKNTIMVDIREFYENEEGMLKPSKKGIALNVPQWKILIQNVNKVDEAIEEMQ